MVPPRDPRAPRRRAGAPARRSGSPRPTSRAASPRRPPPSGARSSSASPTDDVRTRGARPPAPRPSRGPGASTTRSASGSASSAAHPNHPLWQAVRRRILDAAFAEGRAAPERPRTPRGRSRPGRRSPSAYPHARARAAGAGRRSAASAASARTFEAALQALAAGRRALREHRRGARGAWMIALDARGRPRAPRGRRQGVRGADREAPRDPRRRARPRARLERLKAQAPRAPHRARRRARRGAVLRVVTRNIPALDVRVYRLEMEEYFRRKGTVRGVENLQLEVVKPDRTARWERSTDYAPFALIEARPRACPSTEPGAYVVVAGDEHLTATVLFLVSDVEVVVKKARGRDLFVWAFDREDQAPVAGARVLVAEGSEGARGGQDRRGRRLAAATPAGTADHVLVLSRVAAWRRPSSSRGPPVAEGFQSKAYVTTDRPVYRPGHEVSWRAIFLRGVAAARYASRPRRRGRVLGARRPRADAARGRRRVQSASARSPVRFPLDGAAPLGVWRRPARRCRTRGILDGRVRGAGVPQARVHRCSSCRGDRVVLTGEKVEATAHARATPSAARSRTPPSPTRSTASPTTFDAVRRRGLRVVLPATSAPLTSTRRRRRAAARWSTRGETRDGRRRARLVIAFETAGERRGRRVRRARRRGGRHAPLDRRRGPHPRHPPRPHGRRQGRPARSYRPKQEMRVEVRTVDALERPVARSGGRAALLEIRRRPPRCPRRGRPRRTRPCDVQEEEVERARVPADDGRRDGSAELRVEVPGPGRWRLAVARRRTVAARSSRRTRTSRPPGEAEDLTPRRAPRRRPVRRHGGRRRPRCCSRVPVTGVKALLTYEGERVLAYRFVDVERREHAARASPCAAEHAPNVFFKVAIPRQDRLLEAETEVVVLRTCRWTSSCPREAGPGETSRSTVETRDARGRPVRGRGGPRARSTRRSTRSRPTARPRSGRTSTTGGGRTP